MLQCKYCGVQIEKNEYCFDCALELKLDYTPDISTIPDRIEPIVAYRGWHIRGNRLTAFNGIEVKPYETNEAKCAYSNLHEAPLEECSCGFYAFRTFKEELNPLYYIAVGEVYLWGKIVPHKEGYRAQYCYPKRLYVPEREDNIIEDIAQIYGIKTISVEHVYEVTYCQSLDDYAKSKLKPITLKENDNSITLTSYIARPQCSICESNKKCFTDERNHYFYCVKCLNNRIKQRHIETYQNALNHIYNQQLDAIKMQIKNPFKIEGY